MFSAWQMPLLVFDSVFGSMSSGSVTTSSRPRGPGSEHGPTEPDSLGQSGSLWIVFGSSGAIKSASTVASGPGSFTHLRVISGLTGSTSSLTRVGRMGVQLGPCFTTISVCSGSSSDTAYYKGASVPGFLVWVVPSGTCLRQCGSAVSFTGSLGMVTFVG